MTRQIRGNSRRVVAAALVAAATPIAMSVPSASATSAMPTAPAAASVSAAARQYVAVAKSGSTYRLQLVDRASGKVTRTLASGKAVGDMSPFRDVDLAADGSVYAVVASARRPQVGYGSPLVRYRAGRATTIAHYVTSVEASPNSRTLAVTVASPDGNGDGKGLEALRLLTNSGKPIRTLNSYAFPVDKKTGNPMYETGGLQVEGWVGSSALAVGTGCCSEATSHLVPIAKATSQKSWPTFAGTDDARAIGTRGSSVLVARPMFREDKPNVSMRIGVEVAWLNTKRPKGQIVSRISGEKVSVDSVAASLNRKYGATPLFVAPNTFPYKGSGTVVLAGI